MRRRLISTTRPSITISLFAEPVTAPRAPSSFALSIFAHVLIAAVLYFGLVHAPAIKDPSLFQRYDVRQLDMHPLNPNFPEPPAEAKRQIPYPHYDPESGGGGLPLDLKDAMRTFLSSASGRQTIIQPEVRTQAHLAQPVPLPSVMIWSPGQMPAKKIVAPQPNLDTSAYVTPSLDLPTEELKLADVSITSTDRLPRIDAMPATSTSPIETPTVKPVQKPLITMSQSAEQPTPAAVLSVSNIRMEEGTLFVPPVNDIAKSATDAPTARPTIGTGSGSGDGAGTGSGAGDAATLSDAESVTSDGRRLSSEHIVLPRDGKFSVVVVGSSLENDYPEMPNLWGSRVAYTAYLHVGLKKNWVLQYSATRAADVANAGQVVRMEAPWPYDIKRPNLLTKDLNADALMVHGILNQAGRLESLAIVFPTGFRYTSYVLYALRQWQFRPARQNGQATPVEILLIIPDQLD